MAIFSDVVEAGYVSSTINSFFFNDTATTEIYTLSLHDALPICPADADREPDQGDDRLRRPARGQAHRQGADHRRGRELRQRDRKSTRLNSSHANISYAVFCLKKKKNLAATSQQISIAVHHTSDL